MVRRFRRKKSFFFFFLNEPVPGAPRHALKNVCAHIIRSDCVGPISSNIYPQNSTLHGSKVITRQLHNYTNYTWFPYNGPNLHAVFRDRSWKITHVLCKRLLIRQRKVFLVFFTGNLGLLRPKCPSKNKQQNIWRKKHKNVR